MLQLEDIDILSDALEILGAEKIEDAAHVQYGQLRLSVAPKEGKANTLLADHLFSPALVLAELIELGVLPVSGRRRCALPSLLAATTIPPPSLIVATDYPDDGILGNLKANIERNKLHYRKPCEVHCVGYEWGSNPNRLLHLARRIDDTFSGYDIVIMSDLLHFDSSHDLLVFSLTSLLVKSPHARVYVASGKYTTQHVCDKFLNMGTHAGLVWEEGTHNDSNGDVWGGSMVVSGLDVTQLNTRKCMCRWWIGRWGSKILPHDSDL